MPLNSTTGATQSDHAPKSARRRAPSSWFVPVLLLLGLFAPLLAVTWYSFDLQRRTLASAFDYELATMADVLANGMREPIWNLIPKSGQPLLDAIAADSRVLAVRVGSRAQGEFLSYQGPSHANAEPQLFTRQVSRNGVVIGSLELVVDRSGIADRMADQRQSIYGAMAVQLLISLVIVLIAAHLYGASRREAELRRLNENLNREIVERNEAERAMRQAKEEAQIANRAKSVPGPREP